MLLIANRVARANAFEPDCCANVSRQNLADFFPLVGVHLQQPPNALTPAPTRVQHRVSSLKLSRINADKRQLADKWISHNLERQRRKRRFVIRLAEDLLPV